MASAIMSSQTVHPLRKDQCLPPALPRRNHVGERMHEETIMTQKQPLGNYGDGAALLSTKGDRADLVPVPFHILRLSQPIYIVPPKKVFISSRFLKFSF